MSFDLSVNQNQSVLTKAILIYETKAGYRGTITSYASVHPVCNIGTEKNPKTHIMPGETITTESLLQLLGSLGDQYIINTELIPETVLSYSPSHLVWWMPAGMKRVFFNNRELGKKSKVVPHPPLLFVVHQKQWFVFSLDSNTRPGKDTVLNHAPYFNVYDSGNICIGTASIPDKISTDSIPVWEAAFFNSEFTHVNGQVKKVSHPNGEYAFWKEMLEGKYGDSFPYQYLVPFKLKLTDVLQRIGKREQ